MVRREFLRLAAAVAGGLGISGAGTPGVTAAPVSYKQWKVEAIRRMEAKMMPVGVIASEHMGAGQLVMVGADGLYYTMCSSFGDIVRVKAEAVQFHGVIFPGPKVHGNLKK